MGERRAAVPPACCAASRGDGPAPPVAPPAPGPRPGTTGAHPGAATSLVRLPGGSFLMGGEDPDGFPADGEGPVRRSRCRRSESTGMPRPTSGSPSSWTPPASEPTPSGTAGPSSSPACYLPATPSPTRSRRPRGGGRCTAPTGDTPKDRPRPCPSGWTTRWCTCPGTTRTPTAGGPGGGCPRKPNGSTPPAAASRRHATPGATSWHPAAAWSATSGKAPSPPTTPWPTATSAPRRSTRSTQRLRPPQRRRQRLGVVRRLVQRHPRGRRHGRPPGPARR